MTTEPNDHIRTIEINGHKFEVDLRTAKKVDTYRVGDRVKVLTKDYSGYKADPGVIVGIDAFQNLPTIVVAHIPTGSYFNSDVELKFTNLNAQTKDVEICPMAEDDIIPTRDTILTTFGRSIEKKLEEVRVLEMKREWFLRQYGIAFGVAKDSMAAATNKAGD